MADNVIIPQGGMMTQTPPSDDFNKYIQEMRETINSFDLYLQGKREGLDADGNKVMLLVGKPKINDEGRATIINWMRSFMNPNNYMAKFKSFDTSNNFPINVEDFSEVLINNHRRFALSKTDYEEIHSQLCFLFFSALRKSETDKEYIYQNTRTNYQPQPQEIKPKLFGVF